SYSPEVRSEAGIDGRRELRRVRLWGGLSHVGDGVCRGIRNLCWRSTQLFEHLACWISGYLVSNYYGGGLLAVRSHARLFSYSHHVLGCAPSADQERCLLFGWGFILSCAATALFIF